MANSKYAKYLNQEPRVMNIAHHDFKEVEGRSWPNWVYMSKDIVPGCPIFVDIGWVYGMPKPNPFLFEHSHSYDEVVIHIGNDYKNPTDLGAVMELEVEGEKLTIDKTSAVYLPANVKHGPITWKEVTRPHLEMAITLGGIYD